MNISGYFHMVEDRMPAHMVYLEERTADWLKKGGPAHRALVKIVMDKRLMSNIPYYLNFRY